MNILQAEIHNIMNTSRNLNGIWSISICDVRKLFPNYDRNKTIRKIKSEGHPACLQLNP